MVHKKNLHISSKRLNKENVELLLNGKDDPVPRGTDKAKELSVHFASVFFSY